MSVAQRVSEEMDVALGKFFATYFCFEFEFENAMLYFESWHLMSL